MLTTITKPHINSEPVINWEYSEELIQELKKLDIEYIVENKGSFDQFIRTPLIKNLREIIFYKLIWKQNKRKENQ